MGRCSLRPKLERHLRRPVLGRSGFRFITGALAADTTYVAAYYTSGGRYAADKYGLTNDHSAGPLTALASNMVGRQWRLHLFDGFPESDVGQQQLLCGCRIYLNCSDRRRTWY